MTNPSPSLGDLARVIRRVEEGARRRPLPARRAALEDVLDGAVEDTEHGSIFVVRRRFDLDHRHGAAALGGAGDAVSDSMEVLARRGDRPPPAGGRLLYLDTETTGLAGGTGTYAFLVGVGFYEAGAFEVRQYFMRDLDEEPALLAALDGLFRRFEGLVTYNGSGFDLPLLETRFVLGRRRFPTDAFHLDMLGPARRVWSARLSDCRLATVERAVLGFVRHDDLPGALIPSVYFSYLRRKHPGELPRIFEHNRHDVLSLAALTGWIATAVARAPEPDHHPEDLAGLGRIWETADPERGLACYRMALAGGLGSPGRERLLLRLAAVEKRRTRWEEARALWEAAIGAEPFDPRPWEEIAKVHEHRRRDLARAREVVETALHRARAAGAPGPVLASFAHRLERLTRRLSVRPAPPSARRRSGESSD